MIQHYLKMCSLKTTRNLMQILFHNKLIFKTQKGYMAHSEEILFFFQALFYKNFSFLFIPAYNFINNNFHLVSTQDNSSSEYQNLIYINKNTLKLYYLPLVSFFFLWVFKGLYCDLADSFKTVMQSSQKVLVKEPIAP